MSDWDIKDISIETSDLISENYRSNRNEICKNCDRLSIVKICKECGCFIPLKTYFINATCPLNKW